MFTNKAMCCVGIGACLMVVSLLPSCGTRGGQMGSCGGAPRLVPDYTERNPTGPTFSEYQANAPHFDAICLPEAWHFMQTRWQGLREGIPTWPTIVVIDDGFFGTHDCGVRPEIHPGYPDGTGTNPGGTAWGDLPRAGQVAAYGHHGTAVLSLMASRANNGLSIAGVCGPWSNISTGNQWGARFLPVRIGRGGVVPADASLLVPIFDEVVFSQNEIRLVNLSKTLVDVTESDSRDLERRIRQADAREVVIVTGSGNNRGTVAADRWIRRFDNVVIVGALNANGSNLWIEDETTGTATGPGVDLYAPGKDLSMVKDWQKPIAVDSGTSFAAPLVSGVVAMMQNIDPSLDPWEVRDILVKTADVITQGGGSEVVRRVNAYRAVYCTSRLQRGTIAAPAGGQPVHEWSCEMGALGSASGSRSGP